MKAGKPVRVIPVKRTTETINEFGTPTLDWRITNGLGPR
ncbi:hypothetical protein RUESEDTHA_00841 [Ruegeria sp. THAF57]|nr:hypothetical protein RUESEDTHA_00841 [Ruegeria sp. THAF57]